MNGTIKFYKPEGSYGFITTATSEYFFHLTEWKGEGLPIKGAEVAFEIKQAKRGEQAAKVKPTK